MLNGWLPSAVRPPGHGWTHECPVPASGHGRGGTPGPIPNPEVKPPSADGTAERVRGRAGRRWPAEGIRAGEGGERIRAPLPLTVYAYAQPGRRAPAPCGGPSCICRHSCAGNSQATLQSYAVLRQTSRRSSRCLSKQSGTISSRKQTTSSSSRHRQLP